STWPGLVMLYRLRIWLQPGIHFLVVPHGITVAAVWVDAGIHDDKVVVQPDLRLLVGRINQSPEGHHGCFGGYRLIAMDIVAHPGNGNFGRRRTGNHPSTSKVVLTDGLKVIDVSL